MNIDAWLTNFGACTTGREWAGRYKTLEEAYRACRNPRWLSWIIHTVVVAPTAALSIERRQFVFCLGCAARALMERMACVDKYKKTYDLLGDMNSHGSIHPTHISDVIKTVMPTIHQYSPATIDTSFRSVIALLYTALQPAGRAQVHVGQLLVSDIVSPIMTHVIDEVQSTVNYYDTYPHLCSPIITKAESEIHRTLMSYLTIFYPWSKLEPYTKS